MLAAASKEWLVLAHLGVGRLWRTVLLGQHLPHIVPLKNMLQYFKLITSRQLLDNFRRICKCWVDSHWRYSYINIRLPNGEYIRI